MSQHSLSCAPEAGQSRANPSDWTREDGYPLVPVCAWCRRMRDGAGRWLLAASPLAAEEARRVTYGICLDCARDLIAAAQGFLASKPGVRPPTLAG